MIIGRKGNEYLKRRPGMSIVKVHENIMGSISYSTAALLGQESVAQYQEETYDVVYLAYNAFRSAISQEPTLTQVLPVLPRETVEEETVTDYLYEPDRSEVLEQLLPKNVEVQLFRALLESVASEHGARMSAMDSASKNASEMIGRLTLQYNRARQAAITKELMEIISGAESIK
jgi:F-type H+-transporting ATPase subunit gamma